MHTRTIIRVRYVETDKMGITHHSNYPIWYEMGRADYIRLFGTSYRDMENAGVMTPVLNLNCHYGLPSKYDDKLIIRTWCTLLSAARIEFSYSVKRINDDGTETELGYGSTQHGFVDAKTFRPCNIKKRMPELFEKINTNIKYFV